MTEPAAGLYAAPGPLCPRLGAWKIAVPCLLVYRSLGQFALPEGALEVLGKEPATGVDATTGLAAVMRVCVNGLAATGISTHSAALWFVAATAAACVAVVFATAVRLLPSRRAALQCTLLAATCPAVAFAATSVHLHVAPWLLSALACWAAAGWACSGSRAADRGDGRRAWPWALLTGAVTGVAHASTPLGALLPLAVAPVLWLGAERPHGPAISRWGAQIALALAVHLGIAALALARGLGAGFPGLAEVAACDPGALLLLLAREWLRGCLPLSLVAACLLLHPKRLVPALELHVALAAYLLLGNHATASLGNDGACLLPLVPPAALLAMHALGERRGLVWFLVLLSAAVAWAKIDVRSDWARYRTYMNWVDAAKQGKPFLLLTGPRLEEALRLREPAVPAVSVRQVARGPAPSPVECVAYVRHALANGDRVLLTDEAEFALRDAAFQARYSLASSLLHELDHAFVWRPRHDHGLIAKEMVLR
ncbi:MAG TPA: hypothetical protein VF384_14070 [Planctomycetota bacterium]